MQLPLGSMFSRPSAAVGAVWGKDGALISPDLSNLDFTRNSPQIVEDYNDSLVQVPANVQAFRGGNWATTIEGGAALGGELFDGDYPALAAAGFTNGDGVITATSNSAVCDVTTLGRAWIILPATAGLKYRLTATYTVNSGVPSGGSVYFDTPSQNYTVDTLIDITDEPVSSIRVGLGCESNGIQQAQITISNLSLKQVIPQWSLTDDSGNPLHPEGRFTFANAPRQPIWPGGDELGAELITNGDFTAWIGDDPDGWITIGESGSDPMVTEVAGGARFYSTGAYIAIRQALLTVGKTYQATFTDVVNTTDSLKITTGMVGQLIPAGTNTLTFIATGTSFDVARNAGATDVTVGSISVKQVIEEGVTLGQKITPAGQDRTFQQIAPHADDLITNGTFEDATDWILGTGNWSVANGVATSDGTPDQQLKQTGRTIEAGKTYIFSFEVTEVSQGGARIFLRDGGGSSVYIGEVQRAVGVQTFEYTAVTTTTTVSMYPIDSFIGSVDNISVIALPQISATEPDWNTRARNELLYSNDPDNAAWIQRGTFSAVQNLTGADGVANSGWTLSGIDIGSSGDMYQQLSGLTTASRYEPSLVMKQIATVGVLGVNSPLGKPYGAWSIDLSLLPTSWETIDRNHPSVTVTTEYNTLAGTTSGLQIQKISGTGTLSVGFFNAQLELGEVSTPIITTEGAPAYGDSLIDNTAVWKDIGVIKDAGRQYNRLANYEAWVGADTGVRTGKRIAPVNGQYYEQVAAEGAQLFASPRFETPADWSTSTEWVVVEGKAVFIGSTAAGTVFQNILTINKAYRIEVDVDAVEAERGRLRLGSTYGDYIDAPGSYYLEGICTVSDVAGFVSETLATKLQISRLEVFEIPLTSATEPTWPTTIGDTVVDGTATWENKGLYQDELGILVEPAATNKCECYSFPPADIEQAALVSGQNVVGKVYEIKAQSVLDFTTIGAADNVVGTQFVATGQLTLTAVDSIAEIKWAIGTQSTVANPTNIDGFTVSGDAAGILEIIAADAEATELFGQLEDFHGKIYSVDNSAGAASFTAIVAGDTDVSTANHSLSVWGYKKSGASNSVLSFQGLVNQNFTNTSWGRELFEDVAGGSYRRVYVYSQAGVVTDIVLPQLEELPYATSPIITAGAAATREAVQLDALPTAGKINDISIAVDVSLLSHLSYGNFFNMEADPSNYLQLAQDVADGVVRITKRIGGVNHTTLVDSGKTGSKVKRLLGKMSSAEGTNLSANNFISTKLTDVANLTPITEINLGYATPYDPNILVKNLFILHATETDDQMQEITDYD